jgi:nucleotide-binding universal stress UspA family protein
MTELHRALQPVVVGVDGSDSALEATRWAAREAGWRGAGLRLVYADGWPDTPHVGDPGHGKGQRAVLRRVADQQLIAAAAAAEQTVPGVPVEAVVVDGFPVPVLVAESRKAQLVVVGDRGLGGFTGLLLGSVAVGLAAHAASPVAVVRGAAPPPDGPVVVGVDGSPSSEAALAAAYPAAAARRVPLVAVHTWWDFLIDTTVAPLLDWAAIDLSVEQVGVADTALRALLGRAEHARAVVVAHRASNPPP